MQLFGIVYIAMLFALSLFLVIGSYVLHKDNYWRRVWEKLGKPQVESIRELKALTKGRQPQKKGLKGYRVKT